MADVSALWLRYKETRESGARDALVELYLPLVRMVAGRLSMGLPSQVEVDDLESFGLFGLLEAIERFDPARGVKFETYASTRVRGAIIDGLRAETWAPALRQKARQLDQVETRLETQLGREPLEHEIAEGLGLTVQELHRRRGEVGAALLVSLDDVVPGDEDGLTLGDRLTDLDSPNPEAEALFGERRAILADAIETLTEKERLVITLFYFEGLTAKEIAAVLRLSVARISQLHSKALLRLRGRLEQGTPTIR
ncbi:MAG TPA: FliA/WhiG family RNA polymerase sigma factor [Symbiobacteriaceae bacterium]|nr:FliA/WhiG family RNA polymerase sigma factor [Symbiobacteriaceae bacterium]